MATSDTFNGLDTFEHVVVLMLENRSFDNLLGFLYKDGVPAGKQYAGLQDTPIQMPVPSRASDFDQHKTVPPLVAQDYHQPYPDPGEVYPHINTQLYNHIDPDNLKVDASKMKHPYNIPQPPPKTPNMEGFINDYINTLQAIDCKDCKRCWKCIFFGKCDNCKACEGYHNPTFEQYGRIMQCYTPEQVPVLATLAKEFAVFDHWNCSVPSQTWCNRAFWHAASSGGKVVNPSLKNLASWVEHVYALETIFERMEKHNISHNVYKQEIVALTTLVNGPFKEENVVHMNRDLDTFKQHLKERRLKQYSFVEPKFTGVHNDQHPSAAEKSIIDGPQRIGTVLLGEHLIWDLYTAIFTDDHYKDNTLLIITYDEHGGCFDHIAPPPPEKVHPPIPGMVGEDGFTFDRLGVRVPMVMVSANIKKGTICNTPHDHTSFIHTVSKKWGLGHLTDRDLNANTFESVFSPDKREFPQIAEPIIPKINERAHDDDVLNDLQHSILRGAYFWASRRKKETNSKIRIPKIERIQKVKHARAFFEDAKNLLKGF